MKEVKSNKEKPLLNGKESFPIFKSAEELNTFNSAIKKIREDFILKSQNSKNEALKLILNQ